MPIPIIKNFLFFKVINSCNSPQIFFSFKNTSFGNFKLIFLLLQNFLITLEIIMGLIIENSLKGGKSSSRGKNNEKVIYSNRSRGHARHG